MDKDNPALQVTEFIIGEMKHPNTLEEDLYINSTNINTEFVEHSQRFAWYATAYELACFEENKLKVELERALAHADSDVRAKAKSAAIKMTEKMVENSVKTHPVVVPIHDEYLEAKRNSGILKAAMNAMIHRKDMLVQLGASYRAEGLSDLTLKENNYKQNIRNGV